MANIASDPANQTTSAKAATLLCKLKEVICKENRSIQKSCNVLFLP
ncbi:hypothetical protein SpiGrapes_0098 [Sphaerochaeta pleomorpha str. Grapes]|uniref:Uncharacterized protein n=1 Tax=Sphaerochaeta pleomorpha (strain ATCC BAA-1885 / DSM 22778 / Grapes) TaxID=158190 RepID=G8QT57_SPHPG|nr:hypothetical protein SpiGrapes_0098 [Sphaerochaeta pleomorpha str. Grapes]